MVNLRVSCKRAPDDAAFAKVLWMSQWEEHWKPAEHSHLDACNRRSEAVLHGDMRYGRSMVYDGVCVLLCFGHPTIIRDSLLWDTMGIQIPDGSMTIPI